MIWQVIVERYEQQVPAAVMARLTLDRALPAQWIDEVFEQNRQRQYPRELLFSSIVDADVAGGPGAESFITCGGPQDG